MLSFLFLLTSYSTFAIISNIKAHGRIKGPAMRRLTTKEFIAKAKEVHGDKYDYSLVDYKSAVIPVTIICPLHGPFQQKPVKHLSGGHGCQECGGSRKLTTEEFITKAKTIHNDKYDYSLVEYKNAETPVKIICPEHGMFEQRPQDHVHNRSGCPECYNLKRWQNRSLSHEEQVALITKKNPSVEVLEEIVDDRKKIQCRCKICSHVWSVAPYTLKQGHGCPECGGSKRKDTLRFISDAKAVHGYKYDYSKVEYVNSDTDVIIICPAHGEFTQRPSNHIHKRYGCPKCADRGFLSHDQGRLYIMVDDLEVPTMMKVGVSIDTETRRDQVFTSAKKAGAGIPDLHVIKTWEGPTEAMHALEQALHKSLSQYKINFPMKFDGCQEFFYYRPEVFELVEEHLKTFSKQ